MRETGGEISEPSSEKTQNGKIYVESQDLTWFCRPRRGFVAPDVVLSPRRVVSGWPVTSSVESKPKLLHAGVRPFSPFDCELVFHGSHKGDAEQQHDEGKRQRSRDRQLLQTGKASGKN